MESKLDEVKGVSVQAPKGTSEAALFLFKLWHAQGRVKEFEVWLNEYLERFPDFRELIEASKREQLCEAWPNVVYEMDRWGLPAKDVSPRECYGIRVTPHGLLCMKQLAREPRLVHRQAMIEGEKVDLRSAVALMITTGRIANLADTARLWLACVKNERHTSAQNKTRINLERIIGWRGDDLAAYDPALKAEIMAFLASPASFSRNARERESGKGESERGIGK